MKTPRALLALAVLSISANAIDFTPRYADSIDDGVPMRRMYFTEGGRQIYYRPPTGWTRSGSDESATFRPKDSKHAYVMIENAPAEHARIPPEDRALDVLRQTAVRLVPSGATDVSPTWEVVNPVVLQGWTSFEVGLDYMQFGQHFCRSILFINLSGNRQIHFIVDAPPGEFGALYKAAYRTLATWWEPTE